MKIEFELKSRVKRRPVNNFKSHEPMNGTVVEVLPYNRYKIKWDIKQQTGQQHSTIQGKFLVEIMENNDIEEVKK